MARVTLKIAWQGNSKDELLAFPEDIRAELGYNLWRLQLQEKPMCAFRSLATIASGLWELKEQDADGWYRLVYLTPIDDVIYVLHCFQKKSREMSRSDREAVLRRLHELKRQLAAKRGRDNRG